MLHERDTPRLSASRPKRSATVLQDSDRAACNLAAQHAAAAIALTIEPHYRGYAYEHAFRWFLNGARIETAEKYRNNIRKFAIRNYKRDHRHGTRSYPGTSPSQLPLLSLTASRDRGGDFPGVDFDALSFRDRAILMVQARGHPARRIAEEYGISESAISCARAQLHKRLEEQFSA